MSTSLRFEIHDSDSYVQPCFWRIVNGDAEMAKSETLVSKEYALTIAKFVKESATRISFPTVRLNNTARPYGWRAEDGNHKILIASSHQFATEAEAKAAASLVQNNAWSAQIVDMTRTASRR